MQNLILHSSFVIHHSPRQGMSLGRKATSESEISMQSDSAFIIHHLLCRTILCHIAKKVLDDTGPTEKTYIGMGIIPVQGPASRCVLPMR